MADLFILKQYYELADQLIEIADKEQLAECSRLLALNLAHYQMRYGELPLDETLAITYSVKPNLQEAELVAKGMETMVDMLGNVIQGLEDRVSH